MLRRWHVAPLIVLTLAAFCVLAAVKLRATPKFDRVQVGMTDKEVEAIIGEPPVIVFWSAHKGAWEGDEGLIVIDWEGVRLNDNHLEFRVTDKRVTRRGPLERLAWLAGWR